MRGNLSDLKPIIKSDWVSILMFPSLYQLLFIPVRKIHCLMVPLPSSTHPISGNTMISSPPSRASF